MNRKVVFCLVLIVSAGISLAIHGVTYKALDSISGVLLAGTALLMHWHSNRGEQP